MFVRSLLNRFLMWKRGSCPKCESSYVSRNSFYCSSCRNEIYNEEKEKVKERADLRSRTYFDYELILFKGGKTLKLDFPDVDYDRNSFFIEGLRNGSQVLELSNKNEAVFVPFDSVVYVSCRRRVEGVSLEK